MSRYARVGSAVALALMLTGGVWWLSEQGRAEAEQKMQELERELEEAQRTAGQRDQRQDPSAGGGAPTQSPSDFPLRKSEPPAPLKPFLQDPNR